MKILRISLKNIASLAGTHTVDFTREPLRSAGLFSISGKTGAGKSSLLDALCLALYDKTPRLENVGRLEEIGAGEKQGDPRSLLRRGTGEGFAEVAFEGVDGRSWTARWSVRRARRQATGKLQGVEITLFQGQIEPGGDGVVEAGGKKTDVLPVIAQKVGLSFEQFTRAVLLAQNDFATFLKADDKARAEILQALTGTERFETISRAVHARYSSEKKQLDALEAKLEGMAPLDEEGREAAELNAKNCSAKVVELKKTVDMLQKHAEWFTTLAAHRKNLNQASENLAAAGLRLAQSQPRQLELQQTLVIQRDAGSLHEAEMRTANALQKATDLQQKTQTAVVGAETKKKELLKDLQAAEVRAKASAQAVQKLQPDLLRARELDAQLHPSKSNLDKAQKAVAETKDSLDQAVLDQKEVQERFDELNQSKLDDEKQLNVLQDYVPFAGKMEHWLERLHSAAEFHQSLLKSEELLNDATQHCDSVAKQLTEVQQESARLEDDLKDADEQSAEAARDVAKFDVEELTKQRRTLLDRREALGELKHHLESTRREQHSIDKLNDRIQEQKSQHAVDRSRLQQLKTEELPQAQHSLSVQQGLLKKMQLAIDDHATRLRAQLKPEEPCPVCGAEEHPYRDHAPEADLVAVRTTETEVETSTKKLRGLQTTADKLESTVETQELELAKSLTELERQQQELKDNEREFPLAEDPEIAAVLAFPSEERLPEATSHMAAVAADLKKVDKTEEAARAAQKRLAERQKQLAKATETHAAHQRKSDQLASTLKVAETRRGNEQKSFDAATTAVRNAAHPLKELWAAIPDGESRFLAAPEEFQATFQQEVESCESIRGRLSSVEKRLEQLTATLSAKQEVVKRESALWERAVDEHKRVAAAHTTLADQRSKLFEGQPASEVEQQALKQRDEAAVSVEELVSGKNEIDQALTAAMTDRKSAAKAVETAETDAVAATGKLKQWLATFGQTSGRLLEVDDLVAILQRDVAWIQKEQTELQALNDAVKTCEGATASCQKQLDQHLQLCPTKEEEQQIQEELAAATSHLDVAIEQRDVAQSVLLSDDQRRKQSAAQTDEIRKKRTAADPWQKLNDLIGSADGAKFRSIAQRQTLDILLSYANAHLQQLSNRYQLARLPDSLNLIVSDLHMAEERRSVHSLSGGESFLVSLALALGLASLTSNRLRIESLFIDEGFGSLDPETLNIAMNALMHLEAQGRKVGVISHVTEMTDAIPTQVKVVQCSNGAAAIVVPGGPENE